MFMKYKWLGLGNETDANNEVIRFRANGYIAYYFTEHGGFCIAYKRG